MKKWYNNKGFTLIEMLVVLMIISITLLIVVPASSSIIENANTKVCYANVIKLKESYEMHLSLEDVKHTKVLFTRFIGGFSEKICTENGVISYVDGEVVCSKHFGSNVHEENNDGEVPFL